MELIAFGSMIALLLYLIVNHEGDLGMILPIISVYALATFKLMPALQQIYMNIGNIKANISAFESIQLDLENSIKADLKASPPKMASCTQQKISLENITFTYPGKVEPALEKLIFQYQLKI